MSTPFPPRISFLNKTFENSIPWMRYLNGVFFPLGSLISVALTIFHGFNSVPLLTTFTYFTNFLIGFKVKGLEVPRS
jgi:hypothetical protein